MDVSIKKDKKLKEELYRATTLDGKTWIRYSISIWSDIKKTKEEILLKHPALFPVELTKRLIEIFSKKGQLVLDPFAGTGSTIKSAIELGRNAIGIELEKYFVIKGLERLNQINLFEKEFGNYKFFDADANDLLKYVEKNYVDLVITSPPYWDILLEKRTADYKEQRDYGEEKADLGKIRDYKEFLKALKKIFNDVYKVMREEAYCCVIVMDIRKKNKFYPYHSDIANFMQEIGFIYDDIIIWDRRHEYNNLRALGYPNVFRVNKVHEYILIFKKP